jgi:hypothetical protein
MSNTLAARRRIAVLLASVCAWGVAGCGGATSEPDDAATASAEPSATPSFSPLPAPVVSDVEATPIASRVRSRSSIGGGPDGLAAAAGSIWVKTDGGDVLRVDPKTDKQTAKIKVAEELCQGLGADDTAVWACSDDGVVRIDPKTDKIAARVVVDKFNDQSQIPVAFGRAWVLTGDGSRLVGIAGDKADPAIDLGTRCIDLTATRTALWAACPIDGQAVRIDPTGGRVTGRIQGLEEARSIGAGREVWVGYAGGLARIDEARPAVTGVADASTGPFGALFVTPDAVWVRAQGRFLRKVDPRSLKVLEQLEAPEDSGGAVHVLADSLWATAYDDGVLYRLALA